MRIAIVFLLLVSSSVAQMRGHFGGGGFGGRGFGGGGFHGPGVARFGGFGHGVGFRGNGFGHPFPGSFGFNGGPFFPGVPASVTSLGPCGFTPCFGRFGFGHFGHSGFRRFGFSPFFGGGFWGGYPIFVGGYPYYGDGVDNGYPVDQQSMVPQPVGPQQLEITIVDKRHEHDEEDGDDASSARDPESPRNSNLSDAPIEPTIFILVDGTRRDLRNFAIMRGQLVDLSDGKIFRIPIEKVDWKRTLAANAEAGHEIPQIWLK
jgi:hypothetical protein